MQIIIVLAVVIFGIGLVVVLAKYALFHPRVNSAIGLALWILVLLGGIIQGEFDFESIVGQPTSFFMILFIMLFVIAVIPNIDRVRDIMIAPRYYQTDLESGLDKLYVIKSLTSLLTSGLSRVVFLLVVDPHIARSVHRSLKWEIHAGRRLTGRTGREGKPIGWPMMSRARSYHFHRQVKRLERKGFAVSNEETALREIKRSREKLEELYPKKTMDALLDTFVGSKAVKSRRERIKSYLAVRSPDIGHLPVSTYEKIPRLVMEAMTEKGMCPLYEIKYFPELQSLNLVRPVTGKVSAWDSETSDCWFDYFIIQALQPFVSDGTFEEGDYNDNDPLDCHAYRYTKSTKQMPSQSPETNPLLALDDD